MSDPVESYPVHRRLYLMVAAGLVALAVAGVLAATHTNPASIQPKVDLNHLPVHAPAPAVEAQGWINSPPLDAAGLAGKVVVYDFWTYSCINCVRTFPYVRSWYDRYRADGLIVIGIHSPEFDFEKNHANVQRAVQNLGVTWPVALDDNMATWSAFQNNSWPADYIADRNNRIRYFHAGEGDYQQTEDVIRTLLGVAPGSPRAGAASVAAGGQAGGAADITPETYLGTLRGTEGVKDGTGSYADPGTPPVDTARLAGGWIGTPEYVEATSARSAIVLHYQAREVNLVLGPPPSGPVALLIELDGKPLPAAYRTPQTMVDGQGRTFVQVADADMYRLVLGPVVEGHALRLTAEGPGLLAYSFTFGA